MRDPTFMPIRAETTLVDGFIESATPGGLVDIVSGSFGAGHDAAARQIAQELRSRGFVTRCWDIVDLRRDRWPSCPPIPLQARFWVEDMPQ